MTRVMFLIQDGGTVDPDDPALPDGVTPEKVKKGINDSMKKLQDKGWDADLVAITPNQLGVARMSMEVKAKVYDCVVVGGAIRLPGKNLQFFEAVLNGLREASPGSAIAFNGSLTDMHEAAERWAK